MPSDAQKRASAKYQKEKTKTLTIRFGVNDMDLFDFIKSQPNIAQYIKGLVREDMGRKQVN